MLIYRCGPTSNDQSLRLKYHILLKFPFFLSKSMNFPQRYNQSSLHTPSKRISKAIKKLNILSSIPETSSLSQLSSIRSPSAQSHHSINHFVLTSNCPQIFLEKDELWNNARDKSNFITSSKSTIGNNNNAFATMDQSTSPKNRLKALRDRYEEKLPIVLPSEVDEHDKLNNTLRQKINSLYSHKNGAKNRIELNPTRCHQNCCRSSFRHLIIYEKQV